ncbi:MAG: pentapeptide repeat-containing protein [Gammaproteobacteria bacterium]|nr:pentapeptide repeat-containing protein [Gammaproteobacteria bacterium]MCF6261314.1 pentapeptide repeat-containing protein [Gammaproteobacteria bacterium]
MGEKIPIVGYPARGQAPEIFAMRLNGSNFNNADMNNIWTIGHFNNSTFVDASIQDSVLSGHFNKALFSNAKLNGTKVSGLIIKANFKNADFGNAYVDGTFNYCNFDNVNFSGAIINRGTKFSSSSFKNANLKGVDLRTIRLEYAVLDGADFTGSKIGGKAYGLRLSKADTSKVIGFGTSPPPTDYNKLPFSKYSCKNEYETLKIINPSMKMISVVKAAEKSLKIAMSHIRDDYIEVGRYSSIPISSVRLLLDSAQKGNCKSREILRRRNDMLMDGDESVKMGYSILPNFKYQKPIVNNRAYKKTPLRSLSKHYFSKFLIKGLHIGQAEKKARTIVLGLGKCVQNVGLAYINNENQLKCLFRNKVTSEFFNIYFKNSEVVYLSYGKTYADKTQLKKSELDVEMAKIKAAFGTEGRAFRCTSVGCMIKNDGISLNYFIDVRRGSYSYKVK